MDILTQMDMISAFDRQVEVRPISCIDQLEVLIREMALFGPAGSRESEQGCQAVRARLAQIDIAETEEETLSVGEGGKRPLGLGVKKVLSLIESARQETNLSQRVEQLSYLVSSNM